MSEHQLYQLIADYLQLNYPSVVYRFDLAADMKLTKGQAARHKRLHPVRGYPDLFIAEEGVFFNDGKVDYHDGLFIELKKDGVRLKKKNGEWASEHIAEQAEMLERLRKAGYVAEFAVGFDHAKEIIDAYLIGKDYNLPVEF